MVVGNTYREQSWRCEQKRFFSKEKNRPAKLAKAKQDEQDYRVVPYFAPYGATEDIKTQGFDETAKFLPGCKAVL